MLKFKIPETLAAAAHIREIEVNIIIPPVPNGRAEVVPGVKTEIVGEMTGIGIIGANEKEIAGGKTDLLPHPPPLRHRPHRPHLKIRKHLPRKAKRTLELQYQVHQSCQLQP